MHDRQKKMLLYIRTFFCHVVLKDGSDALGDGCIVAKEAWLCRREIFK